VRAELEQAGIAVGGIAPIQPTLEDVFISLYSGLVISPDGRNVELERGRLRTIPLFDGFDEASLVAVANRFVTQRVPAGTVLMEEGEIGDRAYIIVNGRVEVLRRQPDGSERLVAVLERGEVFGEIALVRDIPRTATVRTRLPSILICLEREPFLELLDTRPELRAYVESVAATRLEQHENSRQPASGSGAMTLQPWSITSACAHGEPPHRSADRAR
jgi:signal-transduction protein with cAMP-binding, CBS, and nucleotidyltransferase domain